MPEEDVLEGEEAETAAGRTFAGSRRRHPRRPDARIEEEVLQRLAEAGWLDASGVEVEVSDGVVTLEGEVDGRDARRAAEELAAEVSGVVDVVNRLRPRSPRRPPRA